MAHLFRAAGVETGGEGGALAAVTGLRHSDAAFTWLSILILGTAVWLSTLATTLKHTYTNAHTHTHTHTHAHTHTHTQMHTHTHTHTVTHTHNYDNNKDNNVFFYVPFLHNSACSPSRTNKNNENMINKEEQKAKQKTKQKIQHMSWFYKLFVLNTFHHITNNVQTINGMAHAIHHVMFMQSVMIINNLRFRMRTWKNYAIQLILCTKKHVHNAIKASYFSNSYPLS